MWELGVLSALVDRVSDLPSGDLEYDYVGGVSIGSVNSALIATYEKGAESEAINQLKDLYFSRPFSDLIEFRENKFTAPFFNDSVAKNDKFKEFVKEVLGDKEFKRGLSLISSDLISG